LLKEEEREKDDCAPNNKNIKSCIVQQEHSREFPFPENSDFAPFEILRHFLETIAENCDKTYKEIVYKQSFILNSIKVHKNSKIF